MKNESRYRFLDAGFTTANFHSGCMPSRTIRWCVGSNIEDRKCRTMRDVVEAYGIAPSISCIQQSNRTACIDALRAGSSDIVVVAPREEAEARLYAIFRLFTGNITKEFYLFL